MIGPCQSKHQAPFTGGFCFAQNYRQQPDPRVSDLARTRCMFVASARVELQIPGSRSLKDKRQVVRSVVERTRARFNASVAEVEDQDLWDRAVVGIAFVSSSAHHAEEVVEKAVTFIRDSFPNSEVLDHQIDVASPF